MIAVGSLSPQKFLHSLTAGFTFFHNNSNRYPLIVMNRERLFIIICEYCIPLRVRYLCREGGLGVKSQMASIKKNFAFNALLTSANYLFPLIVFPYISRVLGVNNIGICNFVDSVIQNFILISMMGIGMVGIREIVAAKGDRVRLNRVFSSIFYINGLFTLLAVAALVVCSYVVEDFREYRELLFIGIAKLVGNFLMIEWFFKGLEDFKYITVRSILVRLAYVVSVFLFIRSPEDYTLYYILTAGTFVVNALFNMIYGRRFVSLTLDPAPLSAFMKPVLILGVYMIFTNLYISFNTMWLGMQTDDTEVGYFATATKLFSVFIALLTAFTTVMIPRMSDYLKDGKTDMFRGMLAKTVSVLFSFSMPLIYFGIVYAEDIVMVIAGPGYEGARVPMQVCMPLLLIIGYQQVVVLQALLPLKKDNAILVNSMVGGGVALILCFTIVGHLKATGAALVWLGSEIATMTSASVFFYKYMHVSFPIRRILRTMLIFAPLLIVLYFLHTSEFLNPSQLGSFASVMVGGGVMAAYTFVLLYFVEKDPMFVGGINKLLRRKV